MVDPERNTPGDVQAVGPVAAGPMAVPPPPDPAWRRNPAINIMIDAVPFGPCVVDFDVRGGITFRRVEGTPEAQERRIREARKRDERIAEATARSKELFTRLLTDAQRATFENESYVEVEATSGRRYRIVCNHGYSGNIFWVEGREVKGSFCVYPRPNDCYPGCLPKYDAFLGQLLLILTDEDRFLDVGIFRGPVHPTRGPQRRLGWDW